MASGTAGGQERTRRREQPLGGPCSLAAVYGMRQDMLEEVLLPGMLDALGEAEGRALLRAELPRLEVEAERVRQNLGVDVQQPLLRLLRSLA